MNSAALFSLATDVSVGATLIMVTAWILTHFLKNVSASLRHFYWIMIIVGLLLLPAISLVVPKYSVTLLSGNMPDLGGELQFPQILTPTESIAETARIPIDSNLEEHPSVTQESLAIQEFPIGNETESQKLPIQDSFLLVWFIGALAVSLWILTG